MQTAHAHTPATNVPLCSVGHGIRRPIMQSGQKLELLNGQLLGRNPQLVKKFANRRILGAHDSSSRHILRGIDFGWDHAVERVRTARIGPDLNE